jgi:hypothetical protein
MYWIDPLGLDNIHVLPSIIPTGNTTYPNWICTTNKWGIPTGCYPGSTKPDKKRPACKDGCPEILPGTYPFKRKENFPYNPRPGKRQFPALRLGNDGTVPTREPNPNQDGLNEMQGAWLHPGGEDRTQSEGCLTLNPKYWSEFMQNFPKGSSGDITIW